MGSQLCNNHFKVEWGGTNIGFMEVSGLGISLDVVAYRQGASADNAATLMPGQQHFSPVVLKRAIVKSDNDFYNWITAAQFSQAERRDVNISLLDGEHNPTITWTLKNAFPSRLDYAPLNALVSDLATESLTLVHEGLYVRNP